MRYGLNLVDVSSIKQIGVFELIYVHVTYFSQSNHLSKTCNMSTMEIFELNQVKQKSKFSYVTEIVIYYFKRSKISQRGCIDMCQKNQIQFSNFFFCATYFYAFQYLLRQQFYIKNMKNLFQPQTRFWFLY